MNRQELELGRLRRRNQARFDYAVSELGKAIDALTPEFTGFVEIRLPVLSGIVGGAVITVQKREPPQVADN